MSNLVTSHNLDQEPLNMGGFRTTRESSTSHNIKAAALHFENLPKDMSNVGVRSSKGLRLAGVPALCTQLVVATVA